jgi:hypothetical protein
LDRQGRIAALQPIAPGSCASGVDWRGDWLSPAGVDLQINGGLGLAFPELTATDLPLLEELLELLWRDGVEAICPTLVTCAVAPLREALTVLRQARATHRPGRCQLLGAHLEGPFLAPARRGAHPLAHLCGPSPAALEERIGGFYGPAEGAAQGGGSGEAAGRRPGGSAGDGAPGRVTRTSTSEAGMASPVWKEPKMDTRAPGTRSTISAFLGPPMVMSYSS